MAESLEFVLFDMDNVLCAYDSSARAAYLASLAGSTPDRVYEAIWASGFEALGDRGALEGPEYLRGFGERIGYALSLEEWLVARRHAMKPDRAMLDVVAELRGAVDIAVLTNNIELVAEHIDRLFPELPGLFGSRIYASAQFKTAKPDPACFERCLAILQVSPQKVLFVDDRADNVDGARQAGLLAHHHSSVPAFRQILAGHGLV